MGLETVRRFDPGLNFELRDPNFRGGVCVGIAVGYHRSRSRNSRKRYPDVVEVLSGNGLMLPGGNLLCPQRVITNVKSPQLVALEVGTQQVIIGCRFVRRRQVAAEGIEQAQSVLLRQIMGSDVPFGGE